MGDTEKPVDRALREAYMAMYHVVPKAEWGEFEVIHELLLGASRGRKLPEPFLQRVAPVIKARVNELAPATRDALMGLMTKELRDAIEAIR